MKAYIQSQLVGDEDPVVIDCAILECNLQEAIFKALSESSGKVDSPGFGNEIVEKAIYDLLRPYVAMPSVSINFTFER